MYPKSGKNILLSLPDVMPVFPQINWKHAFSLLMLEIFKIKKRESYRCKYTLHNDFSGSCVSKAWMTVPWPEVQGLLHYAKLEKIRPQYLKNRHLKKDKNIYFAQIKTLINLMHGRIRAAYVVLGGLARFNWMVGRGDVLELCTL